MQIKLGDLRTPGVLKDVEGSLLLSFLRRWIFHCDSKHLAKILAQTMACACLNTSSCRGNVTLNSLREFGAREFLVFRLATTNHRNRQEL